MTRWPRRAKGILKPDGSIEILTDLLQWAQWMEDSPLRILRQDNESGFFVSTIFLGLDHSYGYGRPLWFETMVFREVDAERGPRTYYHTRRYQTYKEALAGHADILEKVRSGEIGE